MIMLRREGRPVNGKRFRRLTAEMGIQGKAPARRRTTNSRRDFRRYPNPVERLEVTRPNQVRVADTTCVRPWDEFGDPAVLLDVFTCPIHGWDLGHSFDQGLA
jgi:hypothetical protein